MDWGGPSLILGKTSLVLGGLVGIVGGRRGSIRRILSIFHLPFAGRIRSLVRGI